MFLRASSCLLDFSGAFCILFTSTFIPTSQNVVFARSAWANELLANVFTYAFFHRRDMASDSFACWRNGFVKDQPYTWGEKWCTSCCLSSDRKSHLDTLDYMVGVACGKQRAYKHGVSHLVSRHTVTHARELAGVDRVTYVP